MTALEILKAARAKVAAGWTQRDYEKAGCFCASGAISEATTGDPYRWPPQWSDESAAWTAARLLLQKAIGIDNIVRWNDTPGRTQAEVVAAFDRAIALAEGK